MTKYRESLSIEFVLSQVIKKLGEEEIKILLANLFRIIEM